MKSQSRLIEQGELWQGRSGGYRLARLLSEIAHPLLVTLPTFLPLAFLTAPTLLQGLVWGAVTTCGFSLLPGLLILSGVKRGTYTDHLLSVRSQRLRPLFFSILCMATAWGILLLLQASRPLLATVTAVLIVVASGTAITCIWKISFHLIALTGCLTTYTLLFGPIMLLLAPCLLLVGWARWYVRAHTLAQACAGMLLALVGTVLVFWGFGFPLLP